MLTVPKTINNTNVSFLHSDPESKNRQRENTITIPFLLYCYYLEVLIMCELLVDEMIGIEFHRLLFAFCLD